MTEIPVLSPLNSIKTTLAHFLQSGNLADVQFLVGPHKIPVKAHSIILQMRSDVFTSMLSGRWLVDRVVSSDHKEDIDNDLQIEIPNLEPDVFRAFLHYLYTDDVLVDGGEDNLKCDRLLDLLQISDMYTTAPLCDKISAILSSSLSIQNCVNIYESSGVVDEGLNGNAMQFIRGNISQLLHHKEYLSSGRDGHWSFTTWLDILQSEGMVVEEVDLFLAIVKWAEDNEDRTQCLRKSLLPLIRYPIMTSEEFAQSVVPSGLLSNIEVIKVLLFYIDYKGTHSISCLLPYKFQSRSVKRPNTAAELSYFLKRSHPGDVISLQDRLYEGSFILRTSYVTLVGEGPASTLTTTDPDAVILTLEGNRCSISNLRIHQSSDPCNAPRLTKPLLVVKGCRNVLQNLEVNTGSYWTEISLPGGSLPCNKLLKQNPAFAICLVDGSDENSVTNLTCINRGNGVSVEGVTKGNSIIGLESRSSTADGQGRSDFGTAVALTDGSGHLVEGVVGDWYMKLGGGTENVSLSGCDVLGITVDGKGHDFVGVKAKKWIKVRGCGHSFDGECEAGRWDWNRRYPV